MKGVNVHLQFVAIDEPTCRAAVETDTENRLVDTEDGKGKGG